MMTRHYKFELLFEIYRNDDCGDYHYFNNIMIEFNLTKTLSKGILNQTNPDWKKNYDS